MLVIKIIPWILEIKEIFKNNQNDYCYEHQVMKLISKLENNTLTNSLEAISDLENLAKVNPQYHWVIMTMLSNLIRNKAANIEKVNISDSNLNRQIVQAAVKVIVNRNINKDPENEQIDLSYTDLRELNLEGANLENTNLYKANLSRSNLNCANLSGAILSAANLSDAHLNYVNLSSAILSAANLNGSNLTGANLQRANLYLASLKNAILNDVILEGANLREVTFQ